MDFSKLDNIGDDDDLHGVIQPKPRQAPQVAAAPLAEPEGDYPVLDAEYQEFIAWKRQRQNAALRAAQTAPVAEPRRAVGMNAQETVRVICDESPDMPPTGYPVGLNGKCYIIQPNKVVDLPVGVLEIIKNAVTSKPTIDDRTRRITGWHDVPRIPWRYAA